ncbi:serine/threonine-protein kinase PLK4-like [Xenia sp. Carnegie-2017]|uniref:serine/threonine-protein kinase PLK4-like n=1 Tax=Xenia sp. Carnegie-2017 TaxID=2897299 RepID=UPI001F04A0AB|nr:serine/threonine-protein kinase PLK4-like [Xenia sp. Carnegie-2017]
MKNDSQTHVSAANRGTQHWIAPESYIVDEKLFDKARYKPESDVMNAGMVAYFVATKGKHPFGTKVCILQNLLDGKPVGLKEISNVELNDLLSWMLQHKPELRPSAKEALKHPYLLSDEEKFDLLCEVGNQPEIKIQQLNHLLSLDVHEQLNDLKNWKGRIDPEVFSDFNMGHYDATWLGCLKFIQNVDQHWLDEHRTKLLPYIKEGNYKEYFVRVLPELPLLVHRIMRLNEWILRPDMEKRVPIQELLRQPWKCFDKSIIHQELFKKMEEYGRKHPEKVTLLSELRVIFMKEFLLGKGSDGTRVYLALGNDGYGKAVKRIRKDCGLDYTNREKEIFNELNAKRSNYVVNFWDLKDNLDEEYLYMILDLCEESLESYVKSSSLQNLQKVVPTILMQILKGLADLHSGLCPILHRDLRPSNVLRDVDGNFLIADFGISHMFSDETSTHLSIQRGAKNWIAPESYDKTDGSINKVRYKKESDIMNAGMVAYYVATKGKHPFGHERHILDNILIGNPVGLDEIKDAMLKDLLSWMLQLKPEDRPSANEALKHPYLQSDEEKFNMLCDMGNQLELKHLQGQNSPISDVHTQLYGSTEWMKRIDDEVVKDLINFEVNDSIRTLKYESTWAGCLRFIRNVDQHWQNKPRPHLSQYVKQGNYKEHFLQVFPELPLLVHKVIWSTHWKSTPDLEEHFAKLQLKEWKYFDQSIKHKEMFLKLIKYGRDPESKVKCVNDVRVIFSDEFCIGIGNNGNRVYLGLKKDGYGKAVKRIRRDICTNEAENEVKIFNEIKAKKSSYVVNYYHLEENTETEYVYLILDLCEESLESFVKSYTLEDLQKSLPEILKQILKGLADLHSEPNPILHRDLKPSNVLRDAQGQYLIADFGSSRILKNGLKTHVSDATKGTQ